MNPTATTHQRRPSVAVLVVAVLVALGALFAPAASASTGVGPETRVRAFDHPTAALVGRVGLGSSTAVGVSGPSLRQQASATGNATRAAPEAAESFPGIEPGSANGATAGERFPPSVRAQALEENPSTCVYCHMETDAPQVDHAIPRSRGGDATIENAQTTCGHCNASKRDRDFPVNPPGGYEGPWPPPWWPR